MANNKVKLSSDRGKLQLAGDDIYKFDEGKLGMQTFMKEEYIVHMKRKKMVSIV